MKSIDVLGFEEKFQTNIDPWNYRSSAFEHFKCDMLLRACGRWKHGRVLELGCAIGETTGRLAPFSLNLIAVDGAPTAVAEARRRLREERHIRIYQATLPAEMPRGPFDLIIVAEIAYYLQNHLLVELGKKIAAATALRGRVVILNHRRQFHDATQLPALAHRNLRVHLARKLSIVSDTAYFHFDITVLKRPRR